MVYVGVMGHGTVGSGVVELLQKNAESIAKRAGGKILVKKILDLRDFPDTPYHELFTKNADDILEDPEIKIVVEVMGGLNPAYVYTKKALESGKHVVTSNKELVAQHGAELQRIARDNNAAYLFEASVGGGIPIIRPLKQCLAGNEIFEITGILNGTTNYILSQMKDKDKSFDEALADAQAKGYAERDPSADIEGHDAQRKIAILSSIAFQKHVRYSDIKTKGITSVTREDMIYAQELGYVIKLLAHASKSEAGIFAKVEPVLLPAEHPLANVEDVFNSILVKGDAIGDVMFYGRGAGKLPTASAVVGDVIEAFRIPENVKSEILYEETNTAVLSTEQKGSHFLVRVMTNDATALETEVEALLPGAKVHVSNHPSLQGEAAILTGNTLKEAEFEQKLKGLDNLSSVASVIHSMQIVE
jgi:homoserine dehydrogenase